jgi:hypothetical protein
LQTDKALAERDINKKITVLGELTDGTLVCYRCRDNIIAGGGGNTITTIVGEKCHYCEGRTHPGGDGVGVDGGWHYPNGIEAMGEAIEEARKQVRLPLIGDAIQIPDEVVMIASMESFVFTDTNGVVHTYTNGHWSK